MMDFSSQLFGLNMYAGHIITTIKLSSFLAAKVTLILMPYILWNPNNDNGANMKIEEDVFQRKCEWTREIYLFHKDANLVVADIGVSKSKVQFTGSVLRQEIDFYF